MPVTNEEHAPLPWSWKPCIRDGGDIVGGALICRAGGSMVYDVDQGDSAGLSDANAAFIVRCVNAHHDLVAAVVDMVSLWRARENQNSAAALALLYDRNAIVESALKALAKADGNSGDTAKSVDNASVSVAGTFGVTAGPMNLFCLFGHDLVLTYAETEGFYQCKRCQQRIGEPWKVLRPELKIAAERAHEALMRDRAERVKRLAQETERPKVVRFGK